MGKLSEILKKHNNSKIFIVARKVVFEDSRGFITSEVERKRVLDKVARKLSIEPDDLEKALWADREGNLVIKEFQPNCSGGSAQAL